MTDDLEVVRPNEDDEPENFIAEMRAMMMGFGPASSSLGDKITPEHIDKLIDNQPKFWEVSSDDRKHHRSFIKTLIISGLAAFLVLVAILVFSENAEILRDILPILVGLLVGWLGGYSHGKRNATSE